MKRALILLLSFSSVALLFLSCGAYSAPSGGTVTGIRYRAFVSQDVSSSIVLAGLDIVDAQRDLLPLAAPISAGATPGMMVVTPNRNATLVFSAGDSTFNIINNTSETNANRLTLAGFTESFVVSADSQTAYVAVPTAPVVGQSPGAVEVIALASGTLGAEVAIPAVRHLSISHSGDRILAFSDNSNSLAVITPSNIETGNPVVIFVPGFDRPVQAFFSNDDKTAYVVNCGAECSGVQAGVQTLDLTTCSPTTSTCAPPTAAVFVDAASVAVVDGTTMYLAGTPVPPSPCTGQQTAATTCGVLSVLELNVTPITVQKSGIVITDGDHKRIAVGANGQVFVGAIDCTEIKQGTETRGCLSIYNSQSGAVVIPPASGDVTGIQPIANRSVVYVVQNGEVQIYDTTTDKLQATQIDISGQAIDVKTIDF